MHRLIRPAAMWALFFCATSCAVAITISPVSLPDWTVNSPYSHSLSASGCTFVCIWSSGGTLPPGLSVSPVNGEISGTPKAAGLFNFTVTATDVLLNNGSQPYTMAIHATPAIVTPSISDGITGASYSQPLSASDGTPPYLWFVSAGSLPAGITLDPATGLLSGTPGAAGTFTFTVRVADASGSTVTKPFSVTIAAPAASPLPVTLSISGLPQTATSAQQVPFGVTLSSSSSKPVKGQVALSFQPAPSASRDDPAIQFSTGGRSVAFTIPAGSTHAVFPASTIALQTGTVAGTISLSVTSDLSGGNVGGSITVVQLPPVISGATVVTNSSGFQVEIAGFSNSRELTGASFHFTAKAGQAIETSDMTVSLTGSASQWYSSSSSTSFGGQSLLVVPFRVMQGASNGLTSVSVQVQNSRGQSDSAIAGF
jgi:hypothetical protein